jgi:hypothetical protein
MKTLQIDESIFRRAKVLAASKGQSVEEFINSALEEKLRPQARTGNAQPPWTKLAGVFGNTPAQRAETRRIQKTIDAEFERIDTSEN